MGDYDVSVTLLEYTRDQDCGCDVAFWGCGECDVFFHICLQPLSPTQGQICQGNNTDDRVDDTHHFLFASALRGHDTYTWRNVNGQPTFEISVNVFDYDAIGGNDDLGVTNYTYIGNRPTVQTVTTTPESNNTRIKLTMNVTYSSARSGSTTTSKTNSYRTTTTTPTTTTTYTTTTTPFTPFTTTIYGKRTNTPTRATTPFTTTIYRKTINTHKTTTKPFKTTIYRKTINTPTTTPHTLPKLTTSKVCSETAVGDYDVSVTLLEYTRDVDCDCDGLWGCRECDVYFQICLQPLSPTQGQICQGNNTDERVDDTHHFLFASALRGHDTYTWSNVNGQPSFQISVHAFDYDSGLFDDNDDLGVTSYTFRGNRPTVQTVTTNPGNKNMRIKLNVNVSCFFMEHNNITSERNSPISLPPRDTTLGTKTGRVSTATCATCTTTSSTTIGSTTGPTSTTSSTSSTSSLSSASDIVSLPSSTISTTPATTTTNIVQTMASCLTVTTPALRTTAANISLTSRKSSTIPAKTITTVQPTASFNTGKTYPPTTIPSYTPSTTGTRQTSSTTALSYTTEPHSGLTIEHKTGGGKLTILVLGPVSHNQLKNLSQEITKLFQYQKPEDVHFHSQIAFYHNTTDQSSTKIQIVYNCTQCNHTDDWIKDKVRLALQIMNLTLYQEKTIGKNTIANFKNNTSLVVGVVVSILLVIVIVSGAVCWYKRKQHQKSKIKGMEIDSPSHISKIMINEEPPNLRPRME